MLPEELFRRQDFPAGKSGLSKLVVDLWSTLADMLLSRYVYRALVRNHFQLQYNSVGAWLEGAAAAPAKVSGFTDLQSQSHLQDGQSRKSSRVSASKMEPSPSRPTNSRPLILNDQVVDRKPRHRID